MTKRKSIIIIRNVHQLIKELGGARYLATRYGYASESGVNNWKLRGIPTGMHYRLDRDARMLGFEIDPSVFGYTAEEWAA